jgi:uncharacterized protein YcaQ
MPASPTDLSEALPLVPPETARRLLLAGQGLADDPRQAATPAAVQARIEAMGFVQVDSINVVERAHHLILASRFDGYRPPLLSRLLEKERGLFENWTHDASAIPTRWFPYWRVRFARYRGHNRKWWQERLGGDPERMLGQVLARIEKEGPLMAKDFSPESTAGSGSWWGWRPEKAALEHLWRTGKLAIAKRAHFHKVYDLTERVLPAAAALPRPSDAEHLEWACRTALERLGVATAGEIADFWHILTPEAAAGWCEAAAARGEITPVLAGAVDDSKPRRAWALPDWEERAANAPEPPPRMRLLAPFEPILRDRKRTRRLFGFDYRFEAFVPGPARQHGYYILPLLEGDRLVGRVDPKFDRKEGLLTIREVWWEPKVRLGTGRKAALEAAVARLAKAIGAERWELPAG